MVVRTVEGAKGVLCLEEEGSSSLGLVLSVLGLAQHSRLKPSGEGSHDPQSPVNLGLGDMGFSERKKIEVWASEGPWCLGVGVYCWPEAWIILSLGVGWLAACGPIEVGSGARPLFLVEHG